MNQVGWITDTAILVFLLLQTFSGWRRGLLWQAASVASIGFGMVLGLIFAPYFSGKLLECVTSDPFRAKLVAFLFIAGMVGFTLRIAAAWAEVHTESGLPKNEREFRRADDRILGGIFGALKGSVLTLLFFAAGVSCCPHCEVWERSMLAAPLAVAGSRLLPDGAMVEVKHWAAQSTIDIQKGLNIK